MEKIPVVPETAPVVTEPPATTLVAFVAVAALPVSGPINDVAVTLPPVLQADLLCETDADEAKLRAIVKETKVVLTCSGPYELYGKTLVKMCAEEGVHYADVTGEIFDKTGLLEQF